MSRAASRTRANSQGGFSVGPDSGMSSKTACWQFWPFTSQLKDDGHGIQTVIPAKERVKKSPNWLKRLKSGPQRRPRAGGDPYKSLFQLDKWIPAFAGMTLRGLPEGCKFDFFTHSQAGIHAGKKYRLCMWLPWVPGCAGTASPLPKSS